MIGSTFLSRLCGGEVVTVSLDCPIHFLSRLCGGEALRLTSIIVSSFLSRLCGGEEMGFGSAGATRVSKPPMWR